MNANKNPNVTWSQCKYHLASTGPDCCTVYSIWKVQYSKDFLSGT